MRLENSVVLGSEATFPKQVTFLTVCQQQAQAVWGGAGGQHMIVSTKVLGWELRRAHVDLIWERMSKICSVLIQLSPISTAGGYEAGVMNGYFCIQ